MAINSRVSTFEDQTSGPAASPRGGVGGDPGKGDAGNVWKDPELEAMRNATKSAGLTNTGGSGGYGRGSGGSGGGSSGPSYTAPTLPSATSQEEYINGMYDAYRQQQEEALRSAYETNLANMDYQAGKLPETYDAAAAQAATQAEINRANYNESAAASGINTGAGSQVRLSQQNALLGNITAIRKAQADAQKDLDFQRTQLQNQYQNAIAEALAQNNLQRAQALYDEAKRVDESMVSTAVNQANLDWTVWNALYNRRR